MDLPNDVFDLTGIYLIDRHRAGKIWYLWTVKDDDWILLKTGDLQTIIKELKEQEDYASDHI